MTDRVGRVLDQLGRSMGEGQVGAFERTLEPIFGLDIGCPRFDSHGFEFFGDRLGRVPHDGPDAVGVRRTGERADDGAALVARRADDDEERCRGILGDRHGGC